MILPIRALGDPVLKKAAKDVPKEYDGLQELIDNMYETMYNANGVGLAAPQVGISIKLFVADTNVSSKKDEDYEPGMKEAFINPEIVELIGDDVDFEEGCLSIPSITEDVVRPEGVAISYFDRKFKKHLIEVDGLLARVIQHEFDHLEGVLFTDHLSPIKKRLLKSKLDKIRKGKIDPPYPMRFVK